MADQTTSSGGPGGDLERRLASAAAAIEKRARSSNIGAWVTLVLAIVLACWLYIFFGQYAVGELEKTFQPKTLIGLVDNEFEKRHEQLKSRIKDEIISRAPAMADDLAQRAIEKAPEWADKAANLMVKNMPKAREAIEKQIEKAAIKGIDQLVQQAQAVTQKTMAEHGKWIAESLDHIQTPEAAEKFQRQLAARIRDEVEPRMRREIERFGSNFAEAANEMDRLKKGVGLTPDETTMRKILMYGKWLEVRKGILKLPEIELKTSQEELIKMQQPPAGGAPAVPHAASPVARPAPGAEHRTLRPAVKRAPATRPAGRAAAPARRKVKPVRRPPAGQERGFKPSKSK